MLICLRSRGMISENEFITIINHPEAPTHTDHSNNSDLSFVLGIVHNTRPSTSQPADEDDVCARAPQEAAVASG